MQVRNIAPFGVRMPPDLKKRLESQATAACRSLNSEIVFRLTESLGREATKGAPDALQSDH